MLYNEISEGSKKSHDVQTWSLFKTFSVLAVVIFIYLMLVIKILPNYMKSRPPFRLKKLLLVFNILQILCSFYTLFIYLRYILYYSWITTRCPQGSDLQGVVEIIVPYFIAKHLDLLDTVFFVLRKKDKQVTFLHIYHHASMVSWQWLYLMYHPSDQFVVLGMLNSFVHVLMYAYYAISSLGPEYAKYIWWKKHLTKIQLVQFIIGIISIYYQQKISPCPIPKFFHYFAVAVLSSFLILFIKFYIDSYNKIKKNRKPSIANRYIGVELSKLTKF